MTSLIYQFHLQLDRIQKLLRPEGVHAPGPKKPSLGQTESTLKK